MICHGPELTVGGAGRAGNLSGAARLPWRGFLPAGSGTSWGYKRHATDVYRSDYESASQRHAKSAWTDSRAFW